MKRNLRQHLPQVCLWLVLCCQAMWGQTPSPPSSTSPTRKPLTISSLPQPAPVKWNGANNQELELQGQLSFAVTQANEDDTLTGLMLYLLPDEQRERLAKQAERPLKDIPPYLVQQNVTVSWVRGTTCPFLKIEAGKLEFEILGGKIHFNHAKLEFRETQDYLPQLFCHWTRQINTRKQRRSIIAAINRALSGGETE